MGIIPIISETLETLLSHPFLAYIAVVSLFFADTMFSGFINFGGAFGWIATQVVQNLMHLPIVVTSFQLLVLVVIFPLISFALIKSRQLQKT